MSKTMIEVKDLTCDYGHGRGVFHLSFAIEQGEVFGFLGPNGAGKTTTIRQLMGFVRPDSGTSGFWEWTVLQMPVKSRRKWATCRESLH